MTTRQVSGLAAVEPSINRLRTTPGAGWSMSCACSAFALFSERQHHLHVWGCAGGALFYEKVISLRIA